jgi:hypothetical protein
MLREGVQECEARIFIQTALDGGRVPKVSEEIVGDSLGYFGPLAAECRRVLARRDEFLKKAAIVPGQGRPWFADANPSEAAYLGYAAEWQEQSDRLYKAAADLAKLGMKSHEAGPHVTKTGRSESGDLPMHTLGVRLACALAALGSTQGLLGAQLKVSPKLLSLPPNTWVKLHEQQPGDAVRFQRQEHGGSCFDTRRGQLVLFGSNTHGRDWTNSPLLTARCASTPGAARSSWSLIAGWVRKTVRRHRPRRGSTTSRRTPGPGSPKPPSPSAAA